MPWHNEQKPPRTSASGAVWTAVGLGAISGLRSTAGPALLSHAAARGDVALEGTRLGFLGSPWASAALKLAFVGELIGDKLPATPPRTAPPPLIGRAASGALVGAAIFASGKRSLPAGALLGAVSAVAAAFAGERLRAEIVARTGVPDPFVAVAEDAVVLAVGTRSLLSYRQVARHLP